MKKLYSKFENLTVEKKQKIINICVEEFAQNGYENASTNTIVKKAEISKGILFHYFGNKKNMYLYIIDNIIKEITNEVFKEIANLPSDIFERILRTGLIKLKIAYKYPLQYKVVFDAFMNTPEDLKNEIKDRYEKMYKENLPLFMKDMDTSRFRPDIDKNKAVELITFTLEGVSNKFLSKLKNKKIEDMYLEVESITKEYEGYIEILKKGLY